MTTPPQNLHPTVLDRFRVAAADTLSESKEAASMRDALDQEIGEAAAQDETDKVEENRLAAELEQVRARRAKRAQQMANQLTVRAAADAKALRLEADGRRALEWIDQMQQGGPEQADVSPGVPPTLVDGQLDAVRSAAGEQA